MEQMFVGVFNAVKKYPEWWGKQTLAFYDRLKFPKFTPEEKKIADKTHIFLKKHQKTIGWTETGIQTAILTVCVAKGYKRLKEPKPKFVHPYTTTRRTTKAIVPDQIIMKAQPDLTSPKLKEWMKPTQSAPVPSGEYKATTGFDPARSLREIEELFAKEAVRAVAHDVETAKLAADTKRIHDTHEAILKFMRDNGIDPLP